MWYFCYYKESFSPGSADNKAGNKGMDSGKATEASTEKADNSVPMTDLKVSALSSNDSCWRDNAVKDYA